MKLVSFVAENRPGYGVAKDDGVIDLRRRFGDLPEAERFARDSVPDFPLEGVQLAPVIPDPDKIICIGMNYRDHVAEIGRTVTEKPSLFAPVCRESGWTPPATRQTGGVR
jgi:2-keto-4-pentenoate hydratase/2-oxohepta-3-ene-1,7-dioic acid hydratase in catechol pathway